MSGFELDLERVKAVLVEATADQRAMSQRKLSRLVAGERGRDTVGDIIHGRNKNPTASLLARIAQQLGGDLSMFGLPVGHGRRQRGRLASHARPACRSA